MDKQVRCSVVMATYNGELYIEEQIDSVLKNLDEDDELIISDDGSSDGTRAIVHSYIEKDSRIQLVDGPQKGVIKNFENGLKCAKGEIIFLCDQDDIWTDNKVETVYSVMSDESTKLVMHDAVVVQDGHEIYASFMNHRGSKLGLFHNVLKNSYIGCCMAFKRELLQYILPFPEKICMHDQWIGLIGEMTGKNVFISDKLISYRRHENNASTMKGLSVLKKIKNRYYMLTELKRAKKKRKL